MVAASASRFTRAPDSSIATVAFMAGERYGDSRASSAAWVCVRRGGCRLGVGWVVIYEELAKRRRYGHH